MSGPSSRKLFADELEARLEQALLSSPSRRSITRLARGLEPLARWQQDLVLERVGVAAQTCAEIGFLIASLAPEALQRLDGAGFAAWVLAGLDDYDREGLRAAIEVLRNLDAFCAQRAGTVAVRFAQVGNRLNRFLQGLAGRPLAVAAGAVAWTDTETVFLPEVLASVPTAAGNRRLYRAMAAHLWAQSHFGTFSVDPAPALADCPDTPLALEWLALTEAVRLESRIAAELPGLAAEMAAARGPWPEALAPALRRLVAPGATVADSLDLARQFARPGRPPPRVAYVGKLDPDAARRVRAERIARETQVLRQALADLRPGVGSPAANPAKWALGPPGENGAPVLTLDGVVLALPRPAEAAARSLLADLGEVPAEALVPAGPGDWLPTRSEGDGPEFASDELPAWRYDEWDFRRSAYRKGWCHVFERAVTPGAETYVPEVRARYRPLIARIRRRFEALRGEDRVLGRQPDGEDVDLDARVDAHIDRRCGMEPSARLFCRRLRNERSMAAIFLVDMSGSTQGWVNDAEREALVMLCEALESLGDAYAIYGFSGWTRTRCDIYPVKSFADAYDDAVRRRIAGIEARDYTRMGFAIRHLSRLLATQPVRHKLLVALSDGRPDDFGDEYRSDYGIEDTRRALQEARRQGIRSYCVTIDRHGADYLKRMYGPASYTVLSEAHQLPAKLAEIYRRLTR